MASRPLRHADRTGYRAGTLFLLAGLACLASGPARADGNQPSSDSQLRALSGTGTARPTDSSALPVLRPDTVDAAALSRAVAAGNRTSRQLVTAEEDSAGSIGGSLLAIAALILAVIVIGRLNSRQQ